MLVELFWFALGAVCATIYALWEIGKDSDDEKN